MLHLNFCGIISGHLFRGQKFRDIQIISYRHSNQSVADPYIKNIKTQMIRISTEFKDFNNIRYYYSNVDAKCIRIWIRNNIKIMVLFHTNQFFEIYENSKLKWVEIHFENCQYCFSAHLSFLIMYEINFNVH